MDWRRWHEEYRDPDSRLSRRLEVVKTRLTEVLDALPQRRLRLLSLCAGEAGDVIPVLGEHPTGRDVDAAVVELDQVLAGRARQAARSAGVELDVRCADAGDPGSFADLVPVDVLLLCGIFGNVEPEGVRAMVSRVPSMVVAGGFVIWTRGGHDGEDDPRADVRRWFADAGMPERSFDGPPETYGVGVNRVEQPSTTPPGSDRLFTFIR